MASKIEKELLAVTGVEARGDDESAQEYFQRIYEKANKMSDTDWSKLSDATQLWVNAAGDAVDEEKPIPNFDGEASEDEPADAGEEEAEPKAETAKAGKGKAKVKEKEQMAKKEKASAKAGAKEKAAAPKKGAAKDAASKAGRKGTFPLEATITVKNDENPHRKTSKDFDKFKKLKSGMTVEKAVAAGVDWGYLRYGVNREIFTIK